MVVIRHQVEVYFHFLLEEDPAQKDIVEGPLSYHLFPKEANKFFYRVGNAIANIGFLRLEVAQIPGAVEAWCYEVNIFLSLVPTTPIHYVEYEFWSFKPNTARYTFPGSISYTPEQVSSFRYEVPKSVLNPFTRACSTASLPCSTTTILPYNCRHSYS
jgi:hypothetical protein